MEWRFLCDACEGMVVLTLNGAGSIWEFYLLRKTKMYIVIVFLWHHALWLKETEVSKEHSAFFFRTEARSSQLLTPNYYNTKHHDLVRHIKVVLFGMRKTLHGCLSTEISTIQFLIEYPVKRTTISHDILTVSSKLSSWSLKSGNKSILFLHLCLLFCPQAADT